MPLAWPSILLPSSELWNVNTNPSRGGGRSTANTEQVVTGPSGYVSASLTVPCNRTDKVLAMRALLAGLDGRAGTLLVGPFEVARAPWFVDPLTGSKVTYGRAAKSAAVDPAFGTGAMTAATLDFRLAADAALNATALVIQRNRGGPLMAGQYLSIAGRLHMITALTTVDTGQVGTVGVTVRPWLRAAYAGGTPVEFGAPLATMRLATDDTGRLELDLSRRGTVTLDLVEAF